MNDYLTVEEVSKELRVNIKTVYQWIKDGRLKAMNIGTKLRVNYRIRRSALEAFLAESEDNF